MKFVRFFVGLLLGMVTITLLTEAIEFTIVKVISGQTLDYLSSNQDEYFEIRNAPWILGLKVLYTFLGSFCGGFVASYIAKNASKITLITLILVQFLGLIYGAFFSEFSSSTPLWMWVLLLVIVPLGIYLGHRFAENINSKK